MSLFAPVSEQNTLWELIKKKLTGKNFIRIILTVGTLFISAGVLGVLVYQQRDVLVNYKWQIHITPLILSFFLFSLDLLLVAKVWSSIMDDLGTEMGFWKHFQYFSIANLTKRIPGTVWYIASRAQFYKDEGISRRQTTLASGVEIAVSIIAGIIISLIFGLSIIARYNISYWVLVLGLIACASILHPKVLVVVMRRSGIRDHTFRYKNLLKWISGYAIAWLVGGLILFAIGNVFWELAFKDIGYIIGCWALVGVLSSLFLFSPSNLGVTEVGLSLLLSQIMPSSVAVLVSIAMRIFILIYEIIWALISLAIKNT